MNSCSLEAVCKSAQKRYEAELPILKQKQLEAQKNSDAVRVTYYKLHNKSIPSDVKYKNNSVTAPDITTELNKLMSDFQKEFKGYNPVFWEKANKFISLVKSGGRVDVKNSYFSKHTHYVYSNELY